MPLVTDLSIHPFIRPLPTPTHIPYPYTPFHLQYIHSLINAVTSLTPIHLLIFNYQSSYIINTSDTHPLISSTPTPIYLYHQHQRHPSTCIIVTNDTRPLTSSSPVTPCNPLTSSSPMTPVHLLIPITSKASVNQNVTTD